MSAVIDIVIPVYNEGNGILKVIDALDQHVKTPFRVLICYDQDTDTTLAALDGDKKRRFPVVRVKNRGRGAHDAVMSGFDASDAPAVIVLPADDDFNASRFDPMVEKFKNGADLVCGSRFIPGGSMERCPWLKATLVRTAAFTLHLFARLPTKDPTNGFRLFSRRVIKTIPVESKQGFAFSLELLVKVHRLGWRVDEVPVLWMERKQGTSRFRLFKWLPTYLRWYFYAFATTWFRRKRIDLSTNSVHS